MADQQPIPADPFALWREWVSDSERQWNVFLNQAMSSEEFSQSLGKFMDVYLNLQKNLNDVMTRYLAVLNLPTRTDVLELGNRLGAIEDRLDSIETAVRARLAAAGSVAVPDGAASAPDAPPRPPRTKKPAGVH